MSEVLSVYQTFTDCVRLMNIFLYVDMPEETAGYEKICDLHAIF